MEQYNVTGMSCAACQARVEKAVMNVPGVTECSVSLLTNSMGVSGSASKDEIIKAVTEAGYGATLRERGLTQDGGTGYEDMLEDTETPRLMRRLILSVALLIPLMYVSMGHMMWNWPLPGFMAGNHIAMGVYELVVTTFIIIINNRFFINGFRGLIHRAPNMDTLVALGATAAYGYSIFSLYGMCMAQKSGDMQSVMRFMDEFYFESAATILTLITVGKMLEARSKGRTTDALKSLMKLAPDTASVIVDGVERSVPVSQVQKGDHFIVRPGESIPVDGIIIKGSSAIDEASLTGESIPVDKMEGNSVYASTISMSGYIECEATKVGEDTTLSQIIQMVSDAAATKAPIAKIADRVSGVFVPVVMCIALVTFIIWIIAAADVGFALARAISVLVISCPCALGLATPVAIMVGSGVGAKNGIMYKTAASLEEMGRIQIIALDKTGTITTGEPVVTGIYPATGIEEDELLRVAYSLEVKSEHPLARAVVSKAAESNVSDYETEDFTIHPGNGLTGMLGDNLCAGGNERFIRRYSDIEADIQNKANELAMLGNTPLFFSRGEKFLGIITVADVPRDDSAEAIRELATLGIHVIMITGDNERTAQAIGASAGVDEVIAGVLPDGKEAIIKQLKKYGKVAMVGDGINDAPALTRADIGIAIGAGTDVAIDAADVVLMKNSLKDVVAAIRVSRSTLRNIHENLFWAFFYNVLGIPLAAGVWIPLLGITLNPMFGAAAMSLSSFCVVSNALRLNFCPVYDGRRDRRVRGMLNKDILIDYKDNVIISNNKEEKNMVIEVKGMMCPHCEAHTKAAIEGIEGVVSAVADHNTGMVTIETSAEVEEAKIKAAVEGAGYEYCGIK